MKKLWYALAALTLVVAGGASAQTTGGGQPDVDLRTVACAAAAIVTHGLSPTQAACFFKLFASLGKSASTAQQPVRPPQSIAEVGVMVLKCYHPTGQFEAIQVVDHPWRAQQSMWNADDSALLAIRYRGGFVGGQYAMVVGLLERHGEIRAVVQQEKSAFPASNGCALNNWIRMAGG